MGGCAAVRRRHTRGGGTKVPPASCESSPLPSGRAARARVSPALPLPPIFGDTVSKISATPRGGRALRARIPVPGRSVAFTETTGEGLTSPAPPPPGSGAKPSRRDVIANKFFHRMWTNLFAVAGSCELPPVGVIGKRGSRPPSCPQCGRAGREYAGKRYAYGQFASALPSLGRALRPCGKPRYGIFYTEKERF